MRPIKNSSLQAANWRRGRRKIHRWRPTYLNAGLSSASLSGNAPSDLQAGLIRRRSAGMKASAVGPVADSRVAKNSEASKLPLAGKLTRLTAHRSLVVSRRIQILALYESVRASAMSKRDGDQRRRHAVGPPKITRCLASRLLYRALGNRAAIARIDRCPTFGA